MNLRTFVIPALTLVLFGCRSHPCGDREADLPASLAELPLLQEGGKACQAQESDADDEGRRHADATVMYWGDHTSKLGVQYITEFNEAGWEQCAPSEYSPAPSEGKLCFEKDDQRLTLSIEDFETPRFGTKLDAPSIMVHVNWFGGE